MKEALLLIISSSLLFYSCGPNVSGHGAIKTDNRTPGSFSGISISIPAQTHIHLQEGAAPSVQLHGYENLIKLVHSEIKNNTLFLSFEKNVRISTDKDLSADITLPLLENLSVSGAGDVDVTGKITGKTFTLDMSGASAVTVENINVGELSADMSGAGDCTIKSGSAERASYALSGTGSISAFPVQAADVSASVSGVGGIELTATRTLNASISGVGGVDYKGHPAVTSHKSGVGSLDDAN